MSPLPIALVVACVACGDSPSGTNDAQIADSTANDSVADSAPVAGLDDRVRACAIVGACMGYDLHRCLGLMDSNAVPNQVSCVNSATAADCTAVRACFGQRFTTTSCTPGCLDGDTRLICTGASAGFELDCATNIEQVGPACVTNGRTDCGGAACSVDGEYTCAGSVSSYCDSGITEVFDCAKRGLECVDQAPRCVGIASGSCTVGTAPACDGDVIVSCDSSGVARREDCNVFAGRTCIPGTPPRCGFANECSFTSDDTCSGNVLQACVAGKQMSIDCTSIGATTCMPQSNGDARCQ